MLVNVFPLLLCSLGLVQSTWLAPLFSSGEFVIAWHGGNNDKFDVDVIGMKGIGARVFLLGAGGIRFAQIEDLPVLLGICTCSAISALFTFSMRSLYLRPPLGKGGRS